MKVYVLLYMIWYEGDEIVGVTASKEKADEWVRVGWDRLQKICPETPREKLKHNLHHYFECEIEKFVEMYDFS